MMVIMLGVYDSESFMPNVLFLLMFCDFPRVPWVGLQCVIVLFSVYTFGSNADKKIIDPIALFGTHCICLTIEHISNRYEACNRK